MPSIKTLSLGLTLATGVVGVGSAVAYSNGAFNSKPTKFENIREESIEKGTSISDLLDKENKYLLLGATSLNENDAWNAAWARYKEDALKIPNTPDKWSIQVEEGISTDYAPQSFKDTCQQKATEQINDREDPKYKDITSYCSRPKTLSEVFEKEGIKLLGTDKNDQTWKSKFTNYKTSDNQIPGAVKATNADGEALFTKLRDGCKNSVTSKTTDTDYQKIYDAVKAWCKETD